jgi:hypothetical protein
VLQSEVPSPLFFHFPNTKTKYRRGKIAGHFNPVICGFLTFVSSPGSNCSLGKPVNRLWSYVSIDSFAVAASLVTGYFRQWSLGSYSAFRFLLKVHLNPHVLPLPVGLTFAAAPRSAVRSYVLKNKPRTFLNFKLL